MKSKSFCIGFSIVCLLFSAVLIIDNKNLIKKNKELEEKVYTLEQNNIDLNWQLGEVGQMICNNEEG